MCNKSLTPRDRVKDKGWKLLFGYRAAKTCRVNAAAARVAIDAEKKMSGFQSVDAPP
jgi:hypothetical protein